MIGGQGSHHPQKITRHNANVCLLNNFLRVFLILRFFTIIPKNQSNSSLDIGFRQIRQYLSHFFGFILYYLM